MARARIGIALLVGAVVGAAIEPACCVDLCVGNPTVAFRCEPSEIPRDERCPATHFCCSDDPATADGALPAYAEMMIADSSAPMFADASNDTGVSGMCVRTSDIPRESGLLDPHALNCPVPCNPMWSEQDVHAVCGESRVCCQTVALHEDDCVRDEDTKKWRAADGRDALASLDGGTRWNPTRDSTHQDPQFDVCAAHAGDRTSQAFRECVAQLTTANQRGYCMSLQPGQNCPTDPDEPPDGAGYRSACDRMND